MKSFIVTDPAGVIFDGERIAQGEPVPAAAPNAQIRAWLRFKQVKPGKAKAAQGGKADDEPKAGKDADKDGAGKP